METRFLDILRFKDKVIAACIDGEEIYPGDYLRLAVMDYVNVVDGNRWVSDYRSIADHTDMFLIDASLVFCNGDSDFVDSHLSDRSKMSPAREKLDAHLRACETAGLELGELDLRSAVPKHVLANYFMGRFEELKRVSALVPLARPAYDYTWGTYQNLLQIEKHGIHVDRDLLVKTITRNDFSSMDKHVRKFFVGTNDTQKDGYVFARYSPLGSKTLRFRSVGGFQAMGIPHGICRETITSRFEGGSIVSCDFNAIDFRCIIKGTKDADLIDMYGKAKDFHAVTAKVIFGKMFEDEALREQIRDVTKKLTYVHIYGGTPETIAKGAQIRIENVKKLLSDFDEKFSAITLFRERLARQFKETGHIELPDGQKIRFDPESHDGKIIGLFAQSFSSLVFSTAVRRTNKLMRHLGLKSKIIFMVHDELVIDMHPNEEDMMPEIVETMAIGPYGEFVVKMKKGANYAEATD